MFAWTLALAAGLGDGLGGAVTVEFALTFAFVLSAVLHPLQKTAKASNSSNPKDRLIEVPPSEKRNTTAWGLSSPSGFVISHSVLSLPISESL